mmetsp:Transcript_2522/g.6254  ORF Transcript_2522/g.6254 Transcript_2522/m.6254 type:complete len:282 (-) Transcript_2522:510-1355(-)
MGDAAKGLATGGAAAKGLTWPNPPAMAAGFGANGSAGAAAPKGSAGGARAAKGSRAAGANGSAGGATAGRLTAAGVFGLGLGPRFGLGLGFGGAAANCGGKMPARSLAGGGTADAVAGTAGGAAPKGLGVRVGVGVAVAVRGFAPKGSGGKGLGLGFGLGVGVRVGIVAAPKGSACARKGAAPPNGSAGALTTPPNGSAGALAGRAEKAGGSSSSPSKLPSAAGARVSVLESSIARCRSSSPSGSWSSADDWVCSCAAAPPPPVCCSSSAAIDMDIASARS